MSRGKRYNDEQKLNVKKVLAVLIAIALVAMFVIGVKNLLKKETVQVNNFSEISYFCIYQDGKWGVINSKGETVVNPEYGEMIAIPNPKKDVFICTYEVNYSDGTYKTKAINSSGTQLYSEYNTVELLSNNDTKGNVWNEEGVLKVGKDGKYGLINYDGTEILACTYSQIETLKGIRNSILTKKDDKYGLVNAIGDRIIENEYASITSIDEDYANGYIVKNSDSKYGIIGANKEHILECSFEDIKHVSGNNQYIVKKDGKWYITEKNNENQTEVNFEDITFINTDVIVAKNNGNYGIYGKDKSEKVAPEYQNLIYAFSDKFIAQKDNKFGIINTNGEVLVQFEYNKLIFNKEADCLFGNKQDDENTYLIDRNLEIKATGKNIVVYNGYIRAFTNEEYKFYNLKLEEKSNREVFPNNNLFVAKNDGKFGLVNKDGTLVVQYQYEDITEQNEYGYVAVKKDGKWGVIDQYGNIVVEPTYDFTDISKITFIGKWHSVENVNTVYLICK